MHAKAMLMLTILLLTTHAAASGGATAGSCGAKYTTVSGTPTMYLVEEPTTAPFLLLYVESNAVPDLQRGGTDLGGTPDPCQAGPDPDTFVGVLF